jgi:hypothetical protein
MAESAFAGMQNPTCLVYVAFMSLDGVVDSPGGGPEEERRSEVSASAVPVPEEQLATCSSRSPPSWRQRRHLRRRPRDTLQLWDDRDVRLAKAVTHAVPDIRLLRGGRRVQRPARRLGTRVALWAFAGAANATDRVPSPVTLVLTLMHVMRGTCRQRDEPLGERVGGATWPS